MIGLAVAALAAAQPGALAGAPVAAKPMTRWLRVGVWVHILHAIPVHAKPTASTGTSLSNLVPGHPSHGCVRMHNKDIIWLAYDMPVGTPVSTSTDSGPRRTRRS